ncbi:MAG TPA: bifunctional aldolase/short-chain dehydrogenase [Steroidobacteraceae bacterium]|nr:bifunctional aldolase/short-chain dehydrogenase [Steroidobacteraceae bacterium]
MKSLWNDQEAALFRGDLAQRVYSSRLLGQDHSLVLHGGGNSSVKIRETNLFGEEEDVLYVKGRGCNLETIDAAGFSACRLKSLRRVLQLETLSDEQMENELTLALTHINAPAPSVETLLHAVLPSKFVDHTHADALLAVMNTPNGLERVQEIYGERVVVVPYVMPGFRLARVCNERFPKYATARTVGVILMHHGLFTFGDSAKSSYERMIDLVHRAEEYLIAHDAWHVEWPAQRGPGRSVRSELAVLRRAASDAAHAPLILSAHADGQALGFARRSDVFELSQRGGATPDHVIRTKRVPLVGRDVAAFCSAYEKAVQAHADGRELPMLDHAPRVILDSELGLCALGRTAEDAAIAEDVYRHTIDTIMRAERLGGWRALPAGDFFDVEYWTIERAKLARGSEPALLGEIALVTGAASGIGKACVASLLARGAAVVALDVAPAVAQLHQRTDYLGIECDLTSGGQIDAALEQAVNAFGGLDLLILNAGVFPRSVPIATLSDELWRKVMSINLDANLTLMRQCHPLLKLAPRGGRVVLIGSKNVMAPGPGAAAYSASKAALQQLARVAALEWGQDRIRVNTLHPNAVFDTGIWTSEVLAERARSYDMSIEEYKTNNVLRVEVTSVDVAELAAELCGPLFAKTTGAQIPVDGGNVRVI